jgi:predicted nucleic acid-binding protein
MPDPAASSGLVLDTSPWINLLATGMIEPILDALMAPCHAPEQVVSETGRHPVTGEPLAVAGHPLRKMARVSIVALARDELELFLDIVGAPAVDALGDGEAACIAVAASRRLDLVMDDRKARRIVRERFAWVRTWWTVDLLQARSVVAALGQQHADECFAKAKHSGRMHVPRS